MSFSTLTDLNNVKNNTKGASVRCYNLVVDQGINVVDLNISDQLNIQNGAILNLETGSSLNFEAGSDITGQPDFDAASVINFQNGSIIEGFPTIGNNAEVEVLGGSKVTFTANAELEFLGHQIVYPTQTVTSNLFWYDTVAASSLPCTTATGDLTFIRNGFHVIVRIPHMLFASTGNAGYFYIPWAGINAEFLPQFTYSFAVPVVNDGVSRAGYLLANTATSRFEVRLSGINANDNFTGTNATNQGLATAIDLGAEITITYMRI